MTMADKFRFDGTDAIVTTYLTIAEIANVAYWQASYDYDFEFHTGHTTGNPIYIRITGNRDTSNVPKFDTLNKNASDYTAIANFANGEKLKRLTQQAQLDVLAVIANNWAILSSLANRYWITGPPRVVAPVVVATTKVCNVPGCGGQVPIVRSGKAPCPVCSKYQ